MSGTMAATDPIRGMTSDAADMADVAKTGFASVRGCFQDWRK
jgi:hypothetical protein